MFHQLHPSSLPRDRVTSFVSGCVGNWLGDGCSMSKTGRGMRLSIDMPARATAGGCNKSLGNHGNNPVCCTVPPRYSLTIAVARLPSSMASQLPPVLGL